MRGRRRNTELTIDEFREILSLPNHLIAIIRPDSTFYKVNEEATPLLGWEPEDLIGNKVKEYVHPEDWEETLARMTSVFLGSEAVVEDMRNRIKRKDGTWRWVSWTGRARGGLIYAHGNDITEKVEYEEALTVQALVLESISEGVIICNAKGQMVFSNTAAEKLFGYDTDELLGQKIFILSGVNEAESKKKVREVVDTLTTDKVWMGEFENLRRDGTRLITGCRVTVLDLHGETHFVCVQRDITRRKIQEEDNKLIADITQILSSSLDYEQNVRNVLGLLVPRFFDSAVVDQFKEGKTFRLATAAERPELATLLMDIHQYESEDVSRNKLQYVSEQREVLIENLGELFSTFKAQPEYVEKLKLLNLKTSYALALMGKDGPVGYIALHLRKDSNKVLDERVQKLSREVAYRLGHAMENSILYHQSLEAIRARDEFLSVASHELKTPLQSLILQNEMRKRMIQKGDPEAVSPENLTRVLDLDRRQLKRINRLIDDMLDISRIRNSKLSIQKEAFDLAVFLEDITDRFLHEFETAGCELKKELLRPLEVVADSYRIEQVIVNLLINAMKYGSGAPITVRTKKLSDRVVIEIEDKGPGIREEDKERIFRRFERANSNQVSGMGLGLYISRQIMELHQGKVYARSEYGKGSTFIVELPL
ncbi:MAG: PAS domain S-box protein [Bacteriovoracaceae bacterium]